MRSFADLPPSPSQTSEQDESKRKTCETILGDYLVDCIARSREMICSKGLRCFCGCRMTGVFRTFGDKERLERVQSVDAKVLKKLTEVADPEGRFMRFCKVCVIFGGAVGSSCALGFAFRIRLVSRYLEVVAADLAGWRER